MQIFAEWSPCPDGEIRPVVAAIVIGAGGQHYPERFLIDSGADHTVFSAELFGKLQLPGQQPSLGFALAGISGISPIVIVNTLVEFASSDGTPARVRGQFAAFTDPAATDLSILGRDVLNNFDLILSRPRNEIVMLSGNHQYGITTI